MANANYKYQNGDDSQRIIPIFIFLALFIANFRKIGLQVFAFFVILQQLKEEKYRSQTDKDIFFDLF